jgi:hypothetical protein
MTSGTFWEEGRAFSGIREHWTIMAQSSDEQGSNTGSPLTKDVDVSYELDIVWVRGGPDDYPYLRESSVKAGTRARPLPHLDKSSIVAYVTLRADAPGVSRGMFERRIWSFQEGRDGHLSPLQGVKPYSIAAGRRSERI